MAAVPRRFPARQVFVGTTNSEHYFKDRTGNRRYWPLTVEARCDVDALARDRDQLWAEAVVRYQASEAWFLTEDQEELAYAEQAKRLEPDDWEEPVLAYVEAHKHANHDGTLHYMTTIELLTECFQITNPLLHTQQHTKRLGSILRAHGWKSQPVRAKDATVPEDKSIRFKAFAKPNPS